MVREGRPEYAIARVLDADEQAVGLAFVVADRSLLTCAHVVNTALGRDQRDPTRPAGRLTVEFPFASKPPRPEATKPVRPEAGAAVRLKAEVAVWSPRKEEPFDRYDVACLTVAGELPAGVPMLELDHGDPAGPVQAWGHVPDRPTGGHVAGHLMGAVDRGRLQVDQQLAGVFRIREGFSGGPVWRPGTGRVVGMVQAVGTGRGATDVYVLDAGRLGKARDAVAAGERPELTVLHLANLRFGAREWRADELLADLRSVRPDLVVVAGNIADRARPAEYEAALLFLTDLRAGLDLEPSRFVLVPGDRDVNAGKCRAYHLDREAEDERPVPPYWPKWEPFARLFTRFYGAEFPKDEPWLWAAIPELRVAVAGINTTMAHCHERPDAQGTLDDAQMNWLVARLPRDPSRQWLRIGVMHHRNPELETREGRLPVRDIYADFDLFIEGTPGEGQWYQLGRAGTPAVGPSIAAPAYQLISVYPGEFRLGARRRDRDGRWVGQDAPRKARRLLRPRPDASDRQLREDDLLDRVREVAELRFPGARITEVHSYPKYLRVAVNQALDADRPMAVEQFPVGVSRGMATEAALESFLRIDAQYRTGGTAVGSRLVYDGPPAPDGLRQLAALRGVELLTFAEFQVGYDLRPYAERQATELGRDAVYPAALYVPQRYSDVTTGPALAGESDQDLLNRLRAWLAEPSGHLVMVLAPFGHGKTFLLRELTRRMYAEGDPAVPVLVQLRDLEKAHKLDELVAAQLTRGGERRIDLAMFRYLLREGRIALLFDGFDELAMRVTYDRATEHLATIVQAAQGRAKVVVTSRDHHFLTDAEVASALGERLTTVAGRRLVKLHPFDDEQIADFLTRRLDSAQKAAERLALLRDVRDLLGLSRNPRMLDFICRIDEERLLAARDRTGTITAAALYRELIEQWLEFERRRLERPGAAPAPTMDTLWHAVTTLALKLWGSAENALVLADLGEAAAAIAAIAPPEEGAPDSHETTHLIGTGTLLLRDGEGRFTFIHGSVLEWLVAKQIAEDLAAGDESPALLQQPLSTLMVEFLSGLTSPDDLAGWVQEVLSEVGAGGVPVENAMLLRERLDAAMPVVMWLAGQDLRGRDLTGHDLRDAVLRDADLTDAILDGADLTGVDMSGATLVGARLNEARLIDADLTGADLTTARLLRADLTGARLDRARLRRAALLGAVVDPAALATADTWGAALRAEDAVPQASPSRRGKVVVAAHPFDDLVAAGSEGAVTVWESRTGVPLRTLIGHAGRVRSVAWSPDGTQLASAGDDGEVRVWDLATTTGIVLTGHTGALHAVAWSPDGRRLASAGDDGWIRLWDVSAGIAVEVKVAQAGAVLTLAWSPGGGLLAGAGDDGVIRLWEYGQPMPVGVLNGHGRIRSLAWSPDGALLASAGEDGAIRLWEAATRTAFRVFGGRTNPSRSVVWWPDGRRLAVGHEDVVRVLDAESGTELHAMVVHAAEVRSLAWMPDETTLVSGTGDGTVCVWDTTSAALRTLSGHAVAVRSVAWSPDGSRLAAGGVDPIRVWDTVSASASTLPEPDAGSFLAVAWSPDGRLLARAGNGGVRVWDVASARVVQRLAESAVVAIAWSPDGTQLAAIDDHNQVGVWDVATATELDHLKVLRPVFGVAWSPDGTRLANGTAKGVALADSATGALIGDIGFRTGPALSVAWSPDGTRIATVNDGGTLHVWNADTRDAAWTRTGHTGSIEAIAWSPDGAWLATAGDVVVRIWAGATGDAHHVLHGHVGRVWSVTWSPDGTRLASAGSDGVVRIWNVRTGKEIGALHAFADGAWAAVSGRRYKADGPVQGQLWWTVGLCRFELGELDGLERIPPNHPLLPVIGASPK